MLITRMKRKDMSHSATKETLNPFEIAQKQVKTACDRLNADPAVYEILKTRNVFWKLPSPSNSTTVRSKPSPATVRNTTTPSAPTKAACASIRM